MEPRAAVDGGCEEFSEAELVAIVRYLHTAAEVLRGFARSHPRTPGEVRRPTRSRASSESAHEVEQVVVGRALVEVHGVETDHDGAHADGSAHIGFV